MSKVFLLSFTALVALFLAQVSPLENGARALAALEFDAAKEAFNRQDYYTAMRRTVKVRLQAPDLAEPWLLAGHCFYLQGKDQAALFHYSRALELDPSGEGLPPFYARLKARSLARKAPSAFTPAEMASLRRKIGQMIMVSVPGTELTGQKKRMLEAGWIGGIILFNQNVESQEQVAAYIGDLQRHSRTPLFVAVDQEGGAVRRFTEDKGFEPLPSPKALGETRDPDLAYRFGLLAGAQLKRVGANLNLAPVVDLDRGFPESIITKYRRSLGPDPGLVSDLAHEIVRGMRERNIIATAKHFPTQTAAEENTHRGTAVAEETLKELERRDFLPYRRLIEKDLLDAVMLSHVVYRDIDPYFPASMSARTIQVLLRRRLGFEGLVISDDLRMGAVKDRFPLEETVVQAVNAGVDILLVTDNMERRVMNGLVEGVLSGRVDRENVEQAYVRIMGIKKKYGILERQEPLAAGLPGVPDPLRVALSPRLRLD